MKLIIDNKIKVPVQRPFAVIMKCSEACNYRCDYCYVEKHSERDIMGVETASAAMEKVFRFVGPGRKVNFVWHGGEPLLAGRAFFESVAAFSRQYKNNPIEHCIQTNGSLLTREILDFFGQHGFLVSVSMDGPRELHDLHRRKRDGSGTYDEAMQAVELLREHNGFPACVAVLHRGNIRQIESIYQFFKQQGIHFRINPVVRSGRAVARYNDLAITADQYGEAMCRLFDLWFGDTAEIQVEPLHTILGNFIAPTVWGCDFHGKCLETIISINPDGAVYPCGRFAGLEEFKLGHILENELPEMFATDVFRGLQKRSPETVPGCSECEFVSICNTGCMITAHMARGNILDRDYYCQGRKQLFRHIAARLEEHLQDIEVA